MRERRFGEEQSARVTQRAEHSGATLLCDRAHLRPGEAELFVQPARGVTELIERAARRPIARTTMRLRQGAGEDQGADFPWLESGVFESPLRGVAAQGVDVVRHVRTREAEFREGVRLRGQLEFRKRNEVLRQCGANPAEADGVVVVHRRAPCARAAPRR